MKLSLFLLRFGKKCLSRNIDTRPDPAAQNKKQALENHERPLDLPGALVFEILARIPIPELRRLIRSPVSPRFSAAIRGVFKEMATQGLQAIMDSDQTGNQDTSAYKRSRKLQFLFEDDNIWQIEASYSAPDCFWRSGALSSLGDSKGKPGTGWGYCGDADAATWIEGGRRFQTGVHSCTACVDCWWPADSNYEFAFTCGATSGTKFQRI